MDDSARNLTLKATKTQARIRDAAKAELIANGGGLEMQAVAARAGVVPSVVSHHFGSRGGLLCALVDEFFDEFHSQVLDEDLRELGTWSIRERERVERGVRFHFTYPLAPIIYGPLASDATVASAEAGRIDRVVVESARNIASAQREGELPTGVDPSLAAASIFGASRQLTVTALTARRRPSQARVVDQLWRITVAAVTPTPKEAPR